MQTFLNNGIALGRAEGKAEGRFGMLFQLVNRGILSHEIAAENASVPLPVFLRMLERYN